MSQKNSSSRPGSLRQRLVALGGLVVIVGVAVAILVAAGVIGGEGGGTTSTGVRIERVDFVDPPRAEGQEGLAVGIEEGELAPDFVISDFEGARRRLSDFRGKVVYLNFWATWCTPCLFELPEIQELQDRNPTNVVVVAVNRRESLNKAESWLRGLPRTDGGKGVSFAVNGLDPNDSLYERYVRLKPAMPVSVFINPQGEISAVYNGAIRLPQMEGAVNEALASTSAASTE